MTISQHVHKGFTLIAVFLFLAVFTTAIILIFSSVSYAAVGLKNAQLKVMATHSSQQLTEWLKYQKDAMGYPYILGLSSVSGETYCFNDITLAWPLTGTCTDFSLDGLYKRELFLQKTSDNAQITATITSSWNSLGFILNSQIVQLFTSR